MWALTIFPNVHLSFCSFAPFVAVSCPQERTELYEVTFETDGPIEMFHLREFGMLTFGSAPDASGSDGRIPTNAAEAMLQCVGSPSCEVEE